MPGVNLEQAHFYEVVDDDAAVFMTDLVKGYGDIHVFVEHPMNEPVELPVEDLKPLTVRPPGSEPKGVWARRVGKTLVVDDQVEERSEAEGSDLEEEPHMQPIDIGEDSTDSWDNQAEDDEVEPGQMSGGIMNSDYESEELLSLDKSSSSSEHCEVSSSDGETPTAEVDNSIRRSR
nr:hypothetical protein CFP56_61175 [Quercus suber]